MNKFLKYKAIFIYIVFGVFTTLVNFAVYHIFTRVIPLHIQLANAIAFVSAVMFAYVVNKQFVFEHKDYKLSTILKELSKFFSLRILGLVFEALALHIFVTILQFHDVLVKVVVAIFIVVFNYIISKFYVFKKG
ncbi:GtrA family protein [Erysipelotrichaceae bacterium OH741_COT-311]|nr:GtrA family protein [Erysipelotrichaceae bacterium OH741_COT-311]